MCNIPKIAYFDLDYASSIYTSLYIQIVSMRMQKEKKKSMVFETTRAKFSK